MRLLLIALLLASPAAVARPGTKKPPPPAPAAEAQPPAAEAPPQPVEPAAPPPATDAPAAPTAPPPAGPASPEAKRPRLKLAAPGLQYVDIDPRKAQFLNDYFAEQLTKKAAGKLEVVTESQVQALIGLERQKVLLGCADESSCVTEIANALGVDGLVIGNVARFGRAYALNVKVISSRDGSVLASAATTGVEEEETLRWLSAASAEVVLKLFPDLKADARASVLEIREADRNAIRLSLLSVEYVRRLHGASWVGARIGGALAFSLNPATVHGYLDLVARYHPLQPDQRWHFGLLSSVGFTANQPSASLGVEGGYQALRVNLEVKYIHDVQHRFVQRLYFYPALSLAFTF